MNSLYDNFADSIILKQSFWDCLSIFQFQSDFSTVSHTLELPHLSNLMNNDLKRAEATGLNILVHVASFDVCSERKTFNQFCFDKSIPNITAIDFILFNHSGECSSYIISSLV